MRSVIASQQLKVIATSGDHPSPVLPGVPLVKDSGYPDYVVTSWNAFNAPSGVPQQVVSKLNAEVNAIVKLPDIQARMIEFGLEPLVGTPEDQARRTKNDIAKWRAVIEKAGIPKE
jgi:tripartite-type tricarboxylate transporter receptor subunit TctC